MYIGWAIGYCEPANTFVILFCQNSTKRNVNPLMLEQSWDLLDQQETKETHFHLGANINKKIAVFRAQSGGIIERYSFENEDGATFTVSPNSTKRNESICA